MRPHPSIPRNLHALLLATAMAASAGCGKNGAGSRSPGSATVDLEAKAAAAKKAARVGSLVELANEDLRNGRYVSAAERAQQALEENPQSADAYAVLGAARWRAGDFDGSTEAFRKALSYDETNFGAVVGLGRNLQAIGDHEGAIELQDRLLAKEKDQVDPMLRKLRSLYALVRPDEAVPLLDNIFKFLPADDPELPVVQSYAAFLRALAGKGKMLERTGKTGTSDVALDTSLGLKHALAVVGGEPVRAVFLEVREEAIVDPGLVKRLKLEKLGEVALPGTEEKRDIVVVPEVKFGDVAIKNVPALVQPLGDYKGLIGEVPIILGRQAMHALGRITFDFPGRSFAIEPSGGDAPGGAEALQLLLLDMRVALAPAVQVGIDGSDHRFFVYFGGVFKAGLSVTRKHYLKSGHLPREVEDPDDPNAGLKMVFVESVSLGGKTLPGSGGLVMVNEPPDAMLGQVRNLAGFELGGYLNYALIKRMRVTYDLPAGKVYLGM